MRDRYSLDREIGRGGMATVYLAVDLKFQRQVALKVLRPELAASLGTRRFRREIEIAARLSHSHILALHDSGETAGYLYYTMPYVEGESLRQRLEREGQLPFTDVISIVREVAGALTYAHQEGIIHRDIKPENILLARNPEGGVHPLVADFGIARALDVAGGERLTETGLILGTPAYMSPEQGEARGRLDGRSDIYSLACVAYEMLAGTPPFTGPTPQSVLARHAVDPVPPLHTLRSTVPASIQAAIEQALSKIPADRFDTANQFAESLVSGKTTSPRRHRRRRNRRMLLLGASVSVLAAAAASVLRLPGSASSAVTPAAASMAVLPFVALSADTGLLRLGRDLAVTLSASLDAVGGIKTTDRLSVANATASKPSLSAAEGAALARRLGATSVLRGTLVGAGDDIRLDFALYDTGALTPLGQAMTVTGHRDSIGALTDSASWALLHQVWRRGKPPSPSLADVTTRSVPAMRAFLEGERELGANHWDKAALAFQRAIAADSGFGLAYFRFAVTQFWFEEPLSTELVAAMHRYQPKFSEREQLLMDAFLTTGQGEHTTRLQFDRLREVTRRFPDYWPGWFLYADQLVHVGPIMGIEWGERVAGLRRVLALNPTLTPAWQHLADLAMGQDLTLRKEALARLAEQGWPPPGDRLLNLLIRLDTATFRAGGVVPPSADAVADSLAQYIASGDEGFALSFSLGLLVQGFPAAQIDLNQRALKLTSAASRVATALEAANAWTWVARGQWDSGLTIMGRLSTTEPVDIGSTVLPLESYGMAVLGAWLGATPHGLADQRRAVAVAALTRIKDSLEQRAEWAHLAWFDGLLGFARGDRNAIRIARQQAARSGWYQADLVDGSLAAFDHALAGDRHRAARELAELDEKCLERPKCTNFTPPIGVQRFAAGTWLQEAGDLAQASRLLLWNENSWPSWRWTSTFALDALAYLARARIEEARGLDSLAQEHYRQFLRRYDRPMPAQAGLVEEAKAALARLGSEN